MGLEVPGTFEFEGPYLRSAEPIRGRASAHADRIGATDDVNLVPVASLPIDEELAALEAPRARFRLVYQPEIKIDHLCTGNLHMAVYFWLERAFTLCGLVAGSNRKWPAQGA